MDRRPSGNRLFCRRGLRGYARIDERLFAVFGQTQRFSRLVGEGSLAITIEPKRGRSPTRVGAAFAGRACGICRDYFAQSEQFRQCCGLRRADLPRVRDMGGAPAR